MRTHYGVIAPLRLRFGHIGAHQAPGDNIAQLLGLILIQPLRLHQRRDHQTSVFYILTRDAGKATAAIWRVKSVAPVVRAKVITLLGSLANATTAEAML